MNKKLFYTILIGFVVLGTIGPIGSNFAHAALFGLDITQIAANLAIKFMTLTGWMMGLAGTLFDFVLVELVVNMSKAIDNVSIIDLGWSTFRDFANILFIFILLYASIATILNVSSFNTKSVLTQLIIVAILINFSLFFTKVIIDVSNVIALQFYNAVEIVEDVNDPNSPRSQGNIAGVFVNAMKIQSLYSGTTGEVGSEIRTLDNNKLFIIGSFGSIFLIITAFIFFAGAILLTIRFVTLIFLMVLAPLAFIAMILPKTQEYSKMWWKELINQSFFAPIYLALIWLVASMVANPAFQANILNSGSTLSDGITEPDGNVGIILGFIIVSAFMIGALVIAKILGARGSGTVMSWGKSATSWAQGKLKAGAGVVARPIVGGVARQAGRGYDRANANLRTFTGKVGAKAGVKAPKLTRFVKGAVKYSGVGGIVGGIAGGVSRGARRTIEKGEKAKFGTKKSYLDVEKEKQERERTISKVQRQQEQEEVIKRGMQASTSKPKDDASPEEKEKHEKDREKDLQDLKDTVRKMGNKEIDELWKIAKWQEQTINSSEFAAQLTDKQMDYVLKSDDYTQQQKGQLIASRKEGLGAILDDPTRGAEVMLEKRKAGEIAKLPVDILKDDRVIATLNPATLTKMIDELSDADRSHIRERLDRLLSFGDDKLRQAVEQWLVSVFGSQF